MVEREVISNNMSFLSRDSQGGKKFNFSIV